MHEERLNGLTIRNLHKRILARNEQRVT